MNDENRIGGEAEDHGGGRSRYGASSGQAVSVRAHCHP
jgi:hypothetical protein